MIDEPEKADKITAIEFYQCTQSLFKASAYTGFSELKISEWAQCLIGKPLTEETEVKTFKSRV